MRMAMLVTLFLIFYSFYKQKANYQVQSISVS